MVLVGCPGTQMMMPQPGPEDALFARYPARVLPWALRSDADQPTGIPVEGSDVDTSLLAAIVNLPNRVVVVFPPKDHEGFVLAWAELDRGWQRMDVPGLAFSNVVSMDAEPAATGAVHLVARTLAPSEVKYFVWKDGAFVTQESIPLATTTRPLWQQHCQDTRVSVSPAGKVAIAFGRNTSQLVVALREGQQFVQSVAMSGLQTATTLEDLGCRNRLSWDDSNQPVVTTLVETRPLTEDHSRPHVHEKTVRSANLDFRGTWQLEGPRLPELKQKGASWRGDFDVARAADSSVMLAGFEFEEFVVAEAFARRGGLGAARFRQQTHFTNEREGRGGVLSRDPCGALSLAWNPPFTHTVRPTEPPDPTPLFQAPFTSFSDGVAAPPECPSPRDAPVVRKADEPHLLASSMVGSHGLHARASSVLCGTQYGVIAICQGHVKRPMSLVGTAGLPAEAGSVLRTVKLSGSAPMNGATNVAADARIVLTVEGSAPLEWWLTNPRGLRVATDVSRASGTVTLTPKEPLLPGQTYRVAPVADVVPHDQPEPIVSFTVAGGEVPTDPRDPATPLTLICTGTVEMDGACRFPVQPNETGRFVDLKVSSHLPPMLPMNQLPTMTFGTVNVPIGVEVIQSGAGALVRVRWNMTLPLGTEQTITLPSTLTSIYGQSLAQPAVVKFLTPPRPIVLELTTPAASSVVAIDTPIRLTFSVAPASLSTVAQGTRLADVATNTAVPLSWLSESATVFRGDHGPLSANTEYELTVAPIRDANANSTTMLTLRFRTSP